MKECCSVESLEQNSSSIPLKVSDPYISFKVSGMDCADEVKSIKTSLNIPEVIRVDANLIKERVTIYYKGNISSEELKKLIEQTGVKVVEEDDSFKSKEKQSARKLLVGFSGASLLLGMGLEYKWAINFDIILVYFLSIIFSGIIIFPKAWRSLRKFTLDMNVLMSIAIVGAFLIKEYSEAASVIFLFSLAELLESMSVARARKAIEEVLNITPEMAIKILIDGKQEKIHVGSLKPDDLVLVKPGERIPIDGEVIKGFSTVNESSLTGEAIPVNKNKGNAVFGGTLNESGALTIRVTALYKDSKISKVISLVEEAQGKKSETERFVDKFARIYTPSMLILGIFVAIIPPLLFGQSWNEYIYKALVLLVIGCPCALVISTPVSVVSGLTALAKRGVLVKGGVFLEALGQIKVLALDKTGTITIGKPEVSKIRLFSQVKESEVLFVAASLESQSSHPLSLAILNYAKMKNIFYGQVEKYQLINGKGAQGVIDGHPYFIGNHSLAHEMGVCSSEVENYLTQVEENAKSVVIVGHPPHDNCKGELLGVFSVGDTIRREVKEAIKLFHENGIELVTILSGDNQKAVDSIAKKVGIDMAKGGLLPEQKVLEIKSLVSKYRYVGMVGDGVNDAPALAYATLGISMGGSGSDTAIETSDVTLMKDSLLELARAIKFGKKSLNVIKFNIYFSILIKVIFFILAFLGMTNLWGAVVADMGASLFVIFNALRLLKG